MAVYRYSGPVWKYDRLVADIWEGVTTAPTKGRAISNLKYRFRQEAEYCKEVPIVLDDDCISQIDE